MTIEDIDEDDDDDDSDAEVCCMQISVKSVISVNVQ